MLNSNSTWRKYVKISLVTLLALLLVHLSVRLSGFIHIFYTHAGVALTQDQVLQAYDALLHYNVKQQPVVPRITHQIFHNWTHPGEETLPLDWQASRQSCLDLNQGWEHMLWTSKASRDFIELEFPWFLPTYDNFRFPVQKIDALRYFLMRHYGGIYIDLDNVWRRRTDDAWICSEKLTCVDRVANMIWSLCATTQPGRPMADTAPSAITSWARRPTTPFGSC
nr:mannosyl phosphorylinositol ceramide synthase sur1 [Quercus suber]